MTVYVPDLPPYGLIDGFMSIPCVFIQSIKGNLRYEWDQLREHDVIFLVTIENPQAVLMGMARDGQQGGAATGHGGKLPKKDVR